jgi:hypothetical protein
MKNAADIAAGGTGVFPPQETLDAEVSLRISGGVGELIHGIILAASL